MILHTSTRVSLALAFGKGSKSAGLGSLHQSSTHGFPSFSIRLPSSRAVELVRGLGEFLSKVFLICQETHLLDKLRNYFTKLLTNKFLPFTRGLDYKRKFKEEAEESENSKFKEKERKRQSRWGPQEVKIEPALAMNSGPISSAHLGFAGPSMANQTVLGRSSFLSRITSADPQILTYAVRVFGTTDLTEDQWKQCMDQVKMQYVYQEMLKKKQERDRLAQVGKVRYEYDSDEETEGGTWEHKRRKAEMEKTKDRADQLTEGGRGKHHLGDFLPPEELAKFMDKFQAVQEGRTIDESDYKEFKIAENNVGYQMLKKFGWTEGEGLGIGGSGITAPVNATRRNEAQGLGAIKPEDLTSNDNEYDAYRKRMMLAYRFRPNPLNNPRRAYY